MLRFADAFATMPLVAILRGIRGEAAASIGEALVDAGFTLIEIPLNSPDPFDSIERLAEAVGAKAAIGAGTVLAEADVARVQQAGGGFVVSPNCDGRVIRQTLKRELGSLPGVFTATEVFAAIGAGARYLKLFPAEIIPPAAVKALKAVLPAGVRLVPTGGVTPANMADYVAAGADGFGLGGALYRPGSAADEVRARAVDLVSAWRGARVGG